MSFNRDLNLELLYEKMITSRSLPPGVNQNNIFSIDEYIETFCGGKKQEIEENLDSENSLDPKVGANIRDMSDEDMKNILKQRAERKILKAATPYIHRSNIVDEDGIPVDPNELKKIIMTRPTTILSQNEKMKKTSVGTPYEVYDISLPAFSGLYVDESSPNKDFKIVRTCPSASECVNYCYARKGSFVQYKDVSGRQSKILNFLMNDWQEFKEQLKAEIYLNKVKAKRNKKTAVIRWHDSGDFFTDGYLEIAFSIARETPDVIHYAYTKEFNKFQKQNQPKNFIFNISSGGRSDDLMDVKVHKSSIVIKKDLFKDLLKKSKDNKWKFTSEDIAVLKNRISEKYNLDRDSIITYKELLNIPYDSSNEPKWFVIVSPEHGDQTAFRKDVQSTLLLIH